ncbi:contractile injection system protein, VgrG/Pvc8 family [Paenibacillus polymyxa]|uniref:contractile injection system protein, VgrG/Pvc8 family n=1 Tax=Paenibacillus TaxID=44249 RepID=UPI0020256E8D|nr:contractile injection system protein, VgrG/Pvc8 family [Paenibacillus polymyxa]URJ38330.1 contractile injection system protein, VgrG/Pvc8 family [Paenibacillus polymyxa]
MSVLSDGIGYESLRFYGPFQPLHIEQLQITRTINDHAFLHISGMLSEEQGAVCIGQDMEQEPIVIRQLNDQGQSLRRLFHGIVTRMSVHCVRGVYTFELEAASHSYQMDIKRKRRSYQDFHRTYDDLVTAMVRKYQYGDAIDTVSNYAKLGTFVLQYDETDWAFLKRLASRFGSVLVPEVTAASPKVFFGMPEGKQHKVEREVFYRVRKTFHELDTEKPGERAGSYITYMIESLQYYALGDLITLPIGQGKELVVVRAVTTLTDGLLRTRYDLQAEQDIHYARYENDQATGISVTGTVLKVQQDFVQLQLDIDPKQDTAKACWFPVSTRYVAEEHSGWYDMPEIGEQVELYLPTHREQDAYVTDSLRQQRHTNGQPNVKVWQHVQGSGVEMSEHELTLSTSGEFSITLHESSGITIDSPGNVQIQGGHVKLDAGEELSLEAGTALYLKGGSSSMVLDGETDTKAPMIYQEGTVKAPVFVADLPPVPEPPLMSIKAYEAAQAPSTAKTSSSSTPTAKVTSPAALQQANSLLGTVSKLLGSIPVMGKVAGVVAGALGGPAAGVILKATAMIPVRSKGTSHAGGSAPKGGLHPLKHLASLALQGLISQYEHERAKEAYYSKWILGKVYTSARHVAHSGGTLELVQNLLKESKMMVHAYQQVPKSVREKWIRDYMKQQPPPKPLSPEEEKLQRARKYAQSIRDWEANRPEPPKKSFGEETTLFFQGMEETVQANVEGLKQLKDALIEHPVDTISTIVSGQFEEAKGDLVFAKNYILDQENARDEYLKGLKEDDKRMLEKGQSYMEGETLAGMLISSLLGKGKIKGGKGTHHNSKDVSEPKPLKPTNEPKSSLTKTEGTGKPKTRIDIMNTVQETLSPAAKKIKELDPDAKVGYRGSLATGQKGPHKGNAPFDPTDFDIDAFIVSDKLASKFRIDDTWRSGAKIKEVEQLQRQADKILKESLDGLRRVDKKGRPDKLTFRIFTQEEYNQKIKAGTQIIDHD